MYWTSTPHSISDKNAETFNGRPSATTAIQGQQVGAIVHMYCSVTLHSTYCQPTAAWLPSTDVLLWRLSIEDFKLAQPRLCIAPWPHTQSNPKVIDLNGCPCATTVVRGLQVGVTAHMYCTLLPARQHPSISCRSLQQAQPRAPGALPRSFPRAPGWECRVFCSICRIYIIVF